jgi:hypothetical protein
VALPIGKLPGWKQFDSGILADRLLAPLAFDAAFDIGSVLEGCAKHLLLLGTVFAPVETVHLDALVTETTGEIVISVTALVGEEQGDRERQNYQRNHSHFFPGRWLVLRHALLLFSSSFF